MVHSLLLSIGGLLNFLGLPDFDPRECLPASCHSVSAWAGRHDRQSSTSDMVLYDGARGKTITGMYHAHEAFSIADVGRALVDRNCILYYHESFRMG
jgi:hypothetical protein